MEGWESIAPSPLGYVRSPTHANAGATEPRRLPDELENVRRSRYFFLAAFFLAAGFLAAFFLAAILVYLLQSISDPMNALVAGPNCTPTKGLPRTSWTTLSLQPLTHHLYSYLMPDSRPL